VPYRQLAALRERRRLHRGEGGLTEEAERGLMFDGSGATCAIPTISYFRQTTWWKKEI